MSAKGFTKYVLPTVVGTMSGMILQTLGEKAIHTAYPPPPGISLDNPEILAKYITTLPNAAFLMLLANFAMCSLATGIISTLVVGRESMRPALIASIILTLAQVFNIYLLPPQPMWFVICSILAHIPFTLLGYFISRKRLVTTK